MASSAEGGASGTTPSAPGVLQGRTAVVAGGSRGIGREVARLLADAGVRVALVARGEEGLRHAAEEVGGHPLPADLATHADVERMAAAARAVFGGTPEILVNAAGTFALAPLHETPPAMLERMLDGNLRAPFFAIRAFLPGMLERGRGHIVTLGSVAGRQAFAHNGAYSASKFGVRGLHAVLDAETRGTGVRATLVEPGATDTSLWDAVDREASPGLPPREAMLPPRAVAEAVLYALSCPPEVDVRFLGVERA